MAALQSLPDAAFTLPLPSTGSRTTLATRSILYAVFKHRRLVIGVFLLVFLASVVAAFMRPSM